MLILGIEWDQYVRTFFSEMYGTALLLFVGCMAEKSTTVPAGKIYVKLSAEKGPDLGVPLAFGLSAFIAIQVCFHNSCGHINPVVTIVGVILNKVPKPLALIYVLGQITGGVIGFGLLQALTPRAEELVCITEPSEGITNIQAVFLEALLTSALMLVVCSVWDPRNEKLFDSVPLKFGFVMFTLAFAGVSYTGCSMNPARSFGPAVWQNRWEYHWIYWVGPFLGGITSAFIYKTFFWPKLNAPDNPTVQILPTIHNP